MGIDFELGDEALDIPAFIFAFIYTLVPLAFFYQYSSGVIKKEKVSILGIFFLYLNGLTYFITTIKNGIEENVKRTIKLRDFSNLSGAILGLGYNFYYIYIMYYKEQCKIFGILICLIIISLLFMILLGLLVPSNIIEYIGSVFNTLEYLPLGFNLIYLIKHMKSEKYVLFGAIPGILNTLIWLIWASIKMTTDDKKYHSLISNILGFLLCVTQFIIFFFFKKEEEISDDPLIENEGDTNEIIKQKEKEKPTIYDEVM